MLLAPARPRSKPSQLASRHGFTSQRENDDESALMHFRARSYDPRTGRFLERDPILTNLVEKHYTFVSNAPTTGKDPTGLQQVASEPPAGSAYEKRPLPERLKGQVRDWPFWVRHVLIPEALGVVEQVRGDLIRHLDPSDNHPQEAAIVREWFGLGSMSAAALDVIHQRYTGLLRYLPEGSAKPDLVDMKRFSFNPDLHARAETRGGGAHPPQGPADWWFIKLGTIFERSHLWTGSGLWSQEGILLHELTHVAWGSEDRFSGNAVTDERSKLRLAREGAARLPEQARDEAANYEFFAESAHRLRLRQFRGGQFQR